MNDLASPASSPPHILAAVGGQDHFWPLLSLGYALAKAGHGRLTLLFVSATGHTPEWLILPAAYADLPIEIETVQSDAPARAILDRARTDHPDLLLVGWRRRDTTIRYLTGGTLDTILRQAPCDVAVVRAPADWPPVPLPGVERLSILLPFAGGPNAPLAMDIALRLAPHAEVTALFIAPEHADTAAFLEAQKHLSELTAPWRDHPRLKTRTVRAPSVRKGILAEAETHDLTMLGATRESIFSQVLFGRLPQIIALQNPHPTLIIQRFDGSVGTTLSRLWWQMTHELPTLPLEERAEVYKHVRRGSRPKIDFFVMIGLAAAIAALGLILNSPAVIIGAMLVAPLMSAIMGLGLGVIQADGRLLQLATSATLRGVLLAVAVGAATGLLLPNRLPTAEMLSRTAPSLLDLGVALVSGLAGAYALCRKEMSASLPGVAIAAALVPPLATAGIGAAWLRWEIAGGALLLFLTNLIAIMAASAFIFFLLGFRPELQKRGRAPIFWRGVFSSILLLGVMAWILGSLTLASVREATLDRRIDRVLRTEVARMEPPVTLNGWHTLQNDDHALKLEVEVRSPLQPTYRSVIALQDRVAAALQLDRPVALTLVHIQATELDPIVPPTATFT
ncbi:MAG: DUF389 domain-containing protein, partial [Caldilineae bacterium]